MFDPESVNKKKKKKGKKRVRFERNDARDDFGLFRVPGGSNGVCRDGREVCWIVTALLPIICISCCTLS